MKAYFIVPGQPPPDFNGLPYCGYALIGMKDNTIAIVLTGTADQIAAIAALPGFTEVADGAALMEQYGASADVYDPEVPSGP